MGSHSESGSQRLARDAEEARRVRAIWLQHGWEAGPSILSAPRIHQFLRWLQDAYARDTPTSQPCLLSSSGKDCVELLERVCREGSTGCFVNNVGTGSTSSSHLMFAQQDVSATGLWIEHLVDSPGVHTLESKFFVPLQLPEAADVVEMLRAFVNSLLFSDAARKYAATLAVDAEIDEDSTGLTDNFTCSSVDTPSLPATLHAFVGHLETVLRRHPVWRHTAADDWEGIVADLEKFLMCKLHNSVFQSHARCTARDVSLASNFETLNFVSPVHLGIDTVATHLSPAWSLAQAALRAMDSYRSPGDKLLCIVNCCRVVSVLLTFCAQLAGQEVMVGADQFVPALIYAVIHSRCAHMYSNIRYIADFTRQATLLSETGYMYTNVLSAMSFARTVSVEELLRSAPPATDAHNFAEPTGQLSSAQRTLPCLASLAPQCTLGFITESAACCWEFPESERFANLFSLDTCTPTPVSVSKLCRAYGGIAAELRGALFCLTSDSFQALNPS
jgi:hypothetical protein